MIWRVFYTVITLNILLRSVCLGVSTEVTEAQNDEPNETSNEPAEISARAHKQKKSTSNKYAGEKVAKAPETTTPVPKKIWRFELDVPEVLRTLKKYTGVNVKGLIDQHLEATQAVEGGSHKYPSKKNLRTIAGQASSMMNQKLQFEVIPPEMSEIVQGVQSIINRFARSFRPQKAIRRFDRLNHGYTEESPGVVKSIVPNYPPKYQEGKLLHLLELQRRRDKAKGLIQ